PSPSVRSSSSFVGAESQIKALPESSNVTPLSSSGDRSSFAAAFTRPRAASKFRADFDLWENQRYALGDSAASDVRFSRRRLSNHKPEGHFSLPGHDFRPKPKKPSPQNCVTYAAFASSSG